jgi:hypothetical protein
LIGTKTPKVRRRNPMMTSTIFTSRNGWTRASLESDVGDGGSRERMVRLARINSKNIRNAAVRIAHAYPTSTIILSIMMGKITPPMLDPLATMP